MKDWTNFWINEGNGFSEIMKISTAVFFKKFDSHFKIRASHKIMDFGCGPGFLLDHLVYKKAYACGVDINPDYLEECRRKHLHLKLIRISPLVEKVKIVLDQECGEQKFDFIVILSVVQYLKNVEALGTLVKSLVTFLENNGKIVIADVIDLTTSPFKDTVALAWHTLLSGEIIHFIKFIKYLVLSDYRRTIFTNKFLIFSEEEITKIANKYLLKCTKVKYLTMHPTRLNYVLSRVR